MKEKNISTKPTIVQNYLSKSLELCQKCGSKRMKVKLMDIPPREREFFKMAMTFEVYKGKSSLVYCNKCEEYSIVSNVPVWCKM